MKKLLLIIGVSGVVFAFAFFIGSSRQAAIDAARLAEQRAAWEAEKAALQAVQAPAPKGPTVVDRVVRVESVKKVSPQELIERLRAADFGQNPNRRFRVAIQQFEDLIEIGTNALPPIGQFLAENQDVDYNFGSHSYGNSSRGQTSLIPSSLRFGLFDVVTQIGGDGAEKILAGALQTTGRGVEVSYLAKALEAMAPNRYRELAVSVARDLLTHPVSTTDKYDRNYLYGVLSMFNDRSLVAQAQSQIIQPDGQIDQVSLRYLEKTLGQQAVAVAAQVYDDTRVDPAKKEPLARVALYFSGLDPQANELFDKAINDNGLSPRTRRHLMEDLNQDGIADRKNPTASDEKIIEARLQLIAKYQGLFTDPELIRGVNEASKDLNRMLTPRVPRQK
ncbi:MAG: hypothetical protein JWM68_5396 [Verrucomicrobiales bacterium]|nr:hypothetical protein [Verrucomicrobiales bacterium]